MEIVEEGDVDEDVSRDTERTKDEAMLEEMFARLDSDLVKDGESMLLKKNLSHGLAITGRRCVPVPWICIILLRARLTMSKGWRLYYLGSMLAESAPFTPVLTFYAGLVS